MDPVRQDSLHMPSDHSGDSVNRLEQVPALFIDRIHPRAPVAEQLPGFLDIFPFNDALKYQPHLVGHALHKLFQSYRLPLQGRLFRPVLSVRQPRLTSLIQLIALSGIGPALNLPNFDTDLNHTLDDVELILDYLRVPEVVAHSLNVGGAHIGAHLLDA